jgi:hypothetical protein
MLSKSKNVLVLSFACEIQGLTHREGQDFPKPQEV